MMQLLWTTLDRVVAKESCSPYAEIFESTYIILNLEPIWLMWDLCQLNS